MSEPRPHERRRRPHATRALALLLLLVGTAATPVAAAATGAPATGYDLSYPQCDQTLPAAGAFAIVGVNSGLPFGANPCLGAAGGTSELRWAGAAAGLYANTADPGPLRSSHWPNGQTAPQPCNTADSPGADTPGCAYDYGWNAAADSYADAVAAYVSLGWAPAGATRTPLANAWWLDVETANSWEASTVNNVAELQGERDFLASAGAASVGFYSPSAHWQQITGGTTSFSTSPAWVPGAASSADGQALCSAPAPSGGPVALVQFPAGANTADLACAAPPQLRLATSAATARPGAASPPLRVELPGAAAAAVTVALTSTSASGRFATAPGGPWSALLTVTVAPGSLQTQPVYYEDTASGTALLQAGATGYAQATQPETIGTPSCTVPKPSDHGFEVALAHAHTSAAAARLLRRVPHALLGRGRRAFVERDGCSDFEVAVTGYRSHGAAVAGVRAVRRTFPQATVERP